MEGARAPSSDLRPLEQAGVPARGWARRGCSGECRADLGGQPQRQGEEEARCPARVALGVDDGVLAGAAVELGDQVTRRWPESSGKPSVPSRALHRLPEREPQPHMLMFWPPAETDTGGQGGDRDQRTRTGRCHLHTRSARVHTRRTTGASPHVSIPRLRDSPSKQILLKLPVSLGQRLVTCQPG